MSKKFVVVTCQDRVPALLTRFVGSAFSISKRDYGKQPILIEGFLNQQGSGIRWFREEAERLGKQLADVCGEEVCPSTTIDECISKSGLLSGEVCFFCLRSEIEMIEEACWRILGKKAYLAKLWSGGIMYLIFHEDGGIQRLSFR